MNVNFKGANGGKGRRQEQIISLWGNALDRASWSQNYNFGIFALYTYTKFVDILASNFNQTPNSIQFSSRKSYSLLCANHKHIIDKRLDLIYLVLCYAHS